MFGRIPQIQNSLRPLNADAVLVTHLPDIRWACGFSGSNGILIIRRDAAHFLSDGRYRTQAEREVSEATIHPAGYDLFGYASEEELLAGAQRVVFQSDHVTVAQLTELEEAFPDLTWQGEKELLVRRVAAKEEWEIDRIRRAQQVTEAVFEHLLGWLRAEMSEQEVAAEIVYQHLRRGAEKMSFDPVVASGPNASLPHARPSGRKLESGDVVLLDFGCFVDGYASDMTRTVALGEPGAEARKVHALVLEAQRRAVEIACAGLPSNELDAAARDVIKEAGFGDYFTHSLGHGVGLQIHEWPKVSYSVDYELPQNCVVSIEPGLYLPERFGVRIEDLVVLRNGTAENLTSAPRELLTL